MASNRVPVNFDMLRPKLLRKHLTDCDLYQQLKPRTGKGLIVHEA